MRLSEIHLGGTYRIREWDDMAAEFGADDMGVKTSGARFTPAMKSLCGMTFTASECYVRAGEVFLKSEEEVEKKKPAPYSCRRQMVYQFRHAGTVRRDAA